jgi:phenylalanyl-tRNA synthetase beta chain
VGAVAHNHARRQFGVGLWEIGHVFLPPRAGDLLPDEQEHVGVVLAGREAPAAVEVWQVIAAQLRIADPSVENAALPGLHPTRGARALASGRPVGIVGEIDPQVLARHDIAERVAYVEIDLDAVHAAPRESGSYRQISRFPSSDIDLAFEVDDDVSALEVESTLRRSHELVWSVRLFDTYRGAPVAEGRRSLAYAVRLQAGDRTLTDSEVAGARGALIAAVESAHGASLRA